MMTQPVIRAAAQPPRTAVAPAKAGPDVSLVVAAVEHLGRRPAGMAGPIQDQPAGRPLRARSPAGKVDQEAGVPISGIRNPA
jgi:hypothetical protein